jgi:hypothetical protein
MAKDNGGEGANDAPEPTIEYVKPNFKRRGVSLPTQVKIPVSVALRAGISRFLLLERDSKIPKVALDWLKSDARYSGLFTKK